MGKTQGRSCVCPLHTYLFNVFLLLTLAFLFALASPAAATRRLLLLLPCILCGSAVDADCSRVATMTAVISLSVSVVVITVAVGSGSAAAVKCTVMVNFRHRRLDAASLERFGNCILNANGMIVCGVGGGLQTGELQTREGREKETVLRKCATGN